MRLYIFILITGFLVMQTAMAGRSQYRHVGGDTSRINDTSIAVNQSVVSDPKVGFRNLYIQGASAADLDKAQLNPRAISFVQDYMSKHTEDLVKLKGWGRPYFDMMDLIFVQHGLPKELKYLAVIESNLKNYAVSWVGAVGPWQFMPGTARDMGLRVNKAIDERTDYHKSTRAAAKYLTNLYDLYKDWLLVIAAYNSGPGPVNSAIRKSGSRDFWTLQYHLPAESRNHVKKFIATHYIMEGEGSVTTLTRQEAQDLSLASVENPAKRNLSEKEMAESTTQPISGRYYSTVIAKYVSMDIRDFNRYNPDFDSFVAMNGKYELRLPADKMTVFVSKRYDILNESLNLLINSFRQSLIDDVPVKSSPKKNMK